MPETTLPPLPIPQPPSLPLPTLAFTATLTMTATTTPSEFVILGSGVSTAIPRISCIIRPTPSGPCKVCHDAYINPHSKNRRCNVSALVRSAGHTVLIDCGKTIRESAIRHFPTLGVQNVDAIVLTHGHADAILGIDDARDIQISGSKLRQNGVVSWIPPKPTPIFLNHHTMKVCENVFPYLMPQQPKKDVPRRVAALSWNQYDESEYFKPFYPVQNVDIQFIPIPMFHGGDYICMGFVITIPQTATTSEMVIAYLSDLHALPHNSIQFLKALPRIDLLVVDILTNTNTNTVHFSKQDAIDLVRQLRPTEAVAVGMTCSIGLHDDVNAELAQLEEEGIKLRLAYDGERFPCNVTSSIPVTTDSS